MTAVKFTGNETEFTGPVAWSRKVILPKRLTDNPKWAAHRHSWLLYSPLAHPLWAFHELYVVSLADLPGVESPKLRFPEATHELGVLALNPEYQPYTVDGLIEYVEYAGSIPLLTPHDICEQFHATDDQMRQLTVITANAVARQWLLPDEDYQQQWHQSLNSTLAHLRGEHDA